MQETQISKILLIFFKNMKYFHFSEQDVLATRHMKDYISSFVRSASGGERSIQMTPKAAKALPQSSTCTAPAPLMKGNT